MGMFREYGKRLNETALAAISKYIDAREQETIAEKLYKKESDPYLDPNHNNYEQQAYAADAKAAYLRSQQKTRDAQKAMLKETDSLMAIRKELQAAISDKLCANGGQVDIGTLELLRSEILRPSEYFTLFSRAKESSNFTMMRLIGRYAGDAAPKAPTKDDEAQLRSLASEARQISMGTEYLQRCDAFIDTYRRTANNPRIAGRWEEMTGEILSGF